MSVAAIPPPKSRINALDVIRGAAILGILMANIAAFSKPYFAMELAPYLGIPVPPQNSLYEGLITALVAGKFRGMLAILFGIGLMMQFQRRDAAGEKWPGSYLKRSLLLVCLGLFHGVFIWHGDILAIYGITALFMMLFAKVSDKTLLWIIAGGLAYGACLGGFTLLSDIMMPKPTSSEMPSSTKELLDKAPMLKMWLTPEGETAAYASGSYAQQMLHRSMVTAFSLMNSVMMLPYFGALFAGGMYIARSRVWEDRARLNRWLGRGMALGFGIGLPLNLLTIPLTMAGHGAGAQVLVEVCLSPYLCVGYLCLLAWLATNLPVVMKPFAAVGKTALSCYLLTSILATTMYYSWGFGFFGRSTVQQDWMITFGIWGVLLIFASLWARFFEYGPIEWLWRSATLGRKLSFRKTSVASETA